MIQSPLSKALDRYDKAASPVACRRAALAVVRAGRAQRDAIARKKRTPDLAKAIRGWDAAISRWKQIADAWKAAA